MNCDRCKCDLAQGEQMNVVRLPYDKDRSNLCDSCIHTMMQDKVSETVFEEWLGVWVSTQPERKKRFGPRE